MIAHLRGKNSSLTNKNRMLFYNGELQHHHITILKINKQSSLYFI